MLSGIKQSDKELIPVIQKYGCLFLCFAESSHIEFSGLQGRLALNYLWNSAVEKGIISGDLNKDGDFDDAGEAEVLDHNALAKLFDLKIRYDGKHHNPEEDIPKEVKIVFGQFYFKGSHFVIVNKNRKVIFDSLGKSNTVKNGYLKSVRWYYYAD